MQTQNYKNHASYYTPHHFVFYPLVLILLGLPLYPLFRRSRRPALPAITPTPAPRA